jgi:hypothetical protein
MALEPATWATDVDYPLLPGQHRPPARGALPRRKRDILCARVPRSKQNAVRVPTVSAGDRLVFTPRAALSSPGREFFRAHHENFATV